jgi:hypothetical protein
MRFGYAFMEVGLAIVKWQPVELLGVDPVGSFDAPMFVKPLRERLVARVNRPGFGEVLYRRMRHAEAVSSRVPAARVAAVG